LDVACPAAEHPVGAGAERWRGWEDTAAELGSYRERFKYVRLAREDGILLVQLHQDGGPAVWTAGAESPDPY
jgi:hypothetical protein